MSTRFRSLNIALAACLLMSPRALADDSPTPSIETLQRNERQDMERRAAEYPQIEPIALRDALVFRMENSALAVFTRLPPTVAMSRVKVDGLPGLCVADVHGAPAPKPSEPYTPTVLMFVHYDFSKPGAIAAALTVQVTPMNMQVSQDIETPNGIRQVSLVQNFPGPGDSEPPVRLRVSIQDKGADGPSTAPAGTQPNTPLAENGEVIPLSIERTAPDFLTLRRSYPIEMARYLQPIFRELQADAAIFSPGRKLAFQVFGPQASADPQMTERVKQIIARLDSDDFHEREAAATDLQKLDEAAVTSLSRLDRGGLSPEQNTRIDSFLASYKPVTDEEAKRLREDVNFLADCLYENDDFVVRSALARLRAIVAQEIPFDNGLRDDARRNAVNQLRRKLTSATTRPAP